MKILLIQPPVRDFYDTAVRLQPLGLACLKACLEKHEVIIRDYHAGYGRFTVPLPAELAYLRPFYGTHDRSPFSTFGQYCHFGADFDDIARDIAAIDPDFAGVAALCSPYFREAIAVARIVKQAAGCPVVVGGGHAAACPEMVLAEESVDFIIVGEGERAMARLADAYEHNGDYHAIAGLGFTEEDRVVLNEPDCGIDPDALPVPDFSDFDLHRYEYDGRPAAMMMTSRSCPFRCSYCSVHMVFGDRYRARSVRNVIDEMKLRYEQGYRVFDFEDDNLTVSRNRVLRLCDAIADTFPAGDIRLEAMNGVCYQGLDGDMLGAMRRAGFQRLDLALVSAAPAGSVKINRGLSVDTFIEVVETASRLGFRITGYQILGLPGEDLDAMIGTMRTMARLPVLMGPSIFYLTPGTAIARDFPAPSEADILRARSTAMAIETDRFSREDIYTLFIATRIINFVKGLTFATDAISLPDLLAVADHDDDRTILGKDILTRLLHGGELLGDNKHGRYVVEKFRPALFFALWEGLDRITTQRGGTVVID